MRYISIFSGIEAASVAWEPLGWDPVAFSEIDEFPSAVLRARYPDVPNLGDIAKVDWSPYVGAVDLVVGGSPCQSFSIAGKREGLSGASGLMFEYIRCIQELMPSWLIWENVPGAFSVERGGAFRQLLESLDELGYGLAWRVLDAQFVRVPEWDGDGNVVGWFGPVAQRRRRVFLVGHLGDMRAAEVLFEPESLRWDTPSSREKRKALTADARRGTQGAGGGVTTFAQNTRDEVRVQGDGTISGALAARPGMKQQTYVAECLTPWDVQSKRVFAEDGCAPTLPSDGTKGMTIQPIVLASGQANAELEMGGVSPTLTLLHEPPIMVAPAQATGKTCSHPSAQRTEASSSSTTRASMEGDSSSIPFDDVTVIDRAAYNQGENAQYPPHIEQTDLMDTLVSRGPHAVGYSYRTEMT